MNRSVRSDTFRKDDARTATWVTPVSLAVLDVTATVAILFGTVLVREHVLAGVWGIEPFSPVRNYASLWPALVLLTATRAVFGLYPGYGLNPAEELRRQTIATALLAFFILAGSALFQFSTTYSRLVLAIAIGGMFVILPSLRAGAKAVLCRTKVYGKGVWIVGRSQRSAELVAVIESSPVLGLRVVGVSHEVPPEGAPCTHCLVVPESLPNVSSTLDSLNRRFSNVWLVPNMLDVSSVWVTPRDLRGHLALELKNNLMERHNRVIKRLLELLMLTLLAPPVAGLILVIAGLIRLDSAGPVFYRQRRVGQHGREFDIIKFRSMVADSDALLAKHLAGNPQAKLEWERHQKLRSDPRVTRVGRVLRRLSLDELPQVWNIALGEMSLVGPRAIMRPELELYGDKAHLYTAVRPGLTGLWQVSGRNDLDYSARVRIDAYYVRNWSIWLDAIVVAKTIPSVVARRGAY